jgi:hypothetical protein
VHWIVWTLNQLAWTTEVVAALLMLVPRHAVPGRLSSSSGASRFIATHIRLGFLCEMVMLGGVLFFHPGAGAIASPSGSSRPSEAASSPPRPPVALAGRRPRRLSCGDTSSSSPWPTRGSSTTFYARARLPGPLQRALDAYTNFFGIIIWRVFSVDVVNFFVRIHAQPAAGGSRP